MIETATQRIVRGSHAAGAVTAIVVMAFTAISMTAGAQQVPPTFRAAVDAVEVDAFVTDRDGTPVRNLTLDDFEVSEDDAPQRITSFSEVSIPIHPPEPYSPTAPEPDVATNTAGEGRLYAIVLDEVHPENALKARAFLRRFIEEHFEASDIGIVVSVGRARATDMQDFTSSRKLLLTAIDRFSGGFPALGDDLTAVNTFATPHSIDVRAQARALRDLLESLAAVQGRRKAVLYVTQEVGQSPMDTGTGRANVWDVIDYRGGVRSIEFDDLRAAMTAAMRGGVAFYTIDPAGLCALDCPEGAENLERLSGLRKLSDATGGFAVANSNRIADAFPRIVAENSNYYVLGYVSSSDKRDGRYRRLHVRVTRPGLTVRFRDGYIAPSKGSTPVDAKPRAGLTLSAGVGEAVRNPLSDPSVPMSVFAGAYRGSRNAAVVVSVELDATRLNLVEDAAGTTGSIEVAAVAVSATGQVSGGQREQFTLRLKPDTWARARDAGIRVVTSLTLPAGRYQLRVAGGNVAAPKAGSVMYDLNVPDFSKSALALSAVSLTSAATEKALTVASRSAMPVTPLAPTTSRTFQTGDTLSVYAELYDNRTREAHRLDLSAELRDGNGQRVGRVVTDSRQNGQAVQRFEPTLPLDVAPGAYVLHVEGRSTLARQPPVFRDVPLRVTPRTP